AGVVFDPGDNTYRVPSFGRTFTVNPAERQIIGQSPDGEVFLKRSDYFFRLSVLWYLMKATPARPSGNLVKPASLPGGDIFVKGSHILPLDALAAKYATQPEAFLAAGAALGGTPAAYGDAAFVLSPFPKVPATILLWTEDDEFPARADLLFDATAPQHLPLDILWSLALMSVLLLLEPGITPLAVLPRHDGPHPAS
ncbi:MAG: DUF3786 domain-containing protein, partial [Gammaproteobacteria bacterium]|nr:DUF3786 domain-containing protein [Gammaproteobacteria bacterium]